jgi:signal transduction histidine kinase
LTLALVSSIVNLLMGIVDHMLLVSGAATIGAGLLVVYLRRHPRAIDAPAALLIIFAVSLVALGWFQFGGILGSGPSLMFPMAGLCLLLTTRRRQQVALLSIVSIVCVLIGVHLFFPSLISPYYPDQQSMLQDMAVSQLLGILFVGILFLRVSAHHLKGWEELSLQQEQNLLLLRASAEKAERELTERLELTRRMSDSLAHDINNMLTVVMGSAQLIAAEEEDENRQAILDSAMTAARLVARYRKHDIEAQECLEIAPVLRSLTRSVSCLAPSVTVQLAVNSPHPKLYTSRVELEQVIMNLCLNAIQSMDGSGLLRLEVNALDSDRNEIIVEDSGDGISEEDLPFIFEPFFTTKKEAGGTGIGLSNVRRIVEQWGGSITVNTTAGQGARFELHLPAA